MARARLSDRKSGSTGSVHVDAAGPDENRGGGSDQSRRTLIIHSPLRNSVRQERLKPKPQLFFFFFLVRLPTLAAALIIACTLLLSRCPPPSHHHPASSHGCGEFAGPIVESVCTVHLQRHVTPGGV